MLTISKPLSARQAQTYHQQGVHGKRAKLFGHNRASSPANGKATSRDNLALLEPC